MHTGPTTCRTTQSCAIRCAFVRPWICINQVTPQDLVNYTKQGLTFDNYFGIPYPFKKYDQILVPDFYGAMENAGAVTLPRDHFFLKQPWRQIKKTKPSRRDHAWNGASMVMISWPWNGGMACGSMKALALLYGRLRLRKQLNYQCLAHFFTLKATKSLWAGQLSHYASDWSASGNNPKRLRQYRCDHLSKGASTLEQLRHLLGDMVFRRGVSNYLKHIVIKMPS